jgi:mycofactocin system glycosyltransferase
VTDEGLPAGWTLTLDPAARRTDGGRVLIGGAPLRVLRLTRAGARWLDRTAAGEPIGRSPASRALARRLTDAGLAVPHPSGPGPLGPLDVAVVIPVRDAADGVRRTLASLGAVGEVVVVDDGSRDPAALRRAAAGAIVLRNDRSLGSAAARERGRQATSKPVLAFLDADVEPEPGWLTALLPHLDDPMAGGVAPRIRPRPGSAPPTLDRYEAVRSPLDLGPLAARVHPGSRVPYVPTALLVVRRSALESVGGFEPGLQVGEDVDLVWRLHEHGWRVRYDPTVTARHPNRATAAAWLRQRVRYGTSAAALARRHGAAMAPLTISGWSALAWSAALFGHPVAALAVGAGTTAALGLKLPDLQRPGHEAMRIAGKGNLWAGRYVTEALLRPWWPLSAVLALTCRRTRPALLAATVLPALSEWRVRRPELDHLRYAAVRLVDDIAYGTGVWIGCARERSFAALRPAFTGPTVPPESSPSTSSH